MVVIACSCWSTVRSIEQGEGLFPGHLVVCVYIAQMLGRTNIETFA